MSYFINFTYSDESLTKEAIFNIEEIIRVLYYPATKVLYIMVKERPAPNQDFEYHGITKQVYEKEILGPLKKYNDLMSRNLL